MLKQLYLEVTQEREDKCTISNECGNRCKIIKSRKLKANVTQNKQIKQTGLEAFRKQKKKKRKMSNLQGAIIVSEHISFSKSLISFVILQVTVCS